MRRGWLILLLAMLVLGFASFGAARLLGARTAGLTVDEPLFARLHAFLGVTREQEARLAGIEAGYGTQRQALRQRVWDARDRFAAVVRDPDSDRAEAMAALKGFASAREAMAANTLEYIFEIRQVLTPAQKAKLAQVMDRGVCSLSFGPCGIGRGRRGEAPEMGTCPMQMGGRGPRLGRQ